MAKEEKSLPQQLVGTFVFGTIIVVVFTLLVRIFALKE